MNKIKYMYIVYIYPGYHYVKTNFPFPDWIYRQCNSKDIEIIDKFWFEHQHCRFFHYFGNYI